MMFALAMILATPSCTPPYIYQPNNGTCQAVFTQSTKPAPNTTVGGQPVTCDPVGRYNAVVCVYKPKGAK